jgi:hypothetical protein
VAPAGSADESFLSASIRLWSIIVILSAVIGNFLAWRLTDCSSNLSGSVTLSVGFALFSLVMCRGVSLWLLRDPKANAILRALAIPIGAVAPLSLGGIALFRMQYLERVETHMCGASFTVGISYVGALIWGILIRHRHRRRRLLVQ